MCNTSGTKQVRSFATAQRYDFIVKRGDNVVWTWAEDRVFAQSTGEETWEPDECRGWTETWDGMTSSGMRAADGKYSVEAVLTTKPEVRPDPITFCHGLC